MDTLCLTYSDHDRVPEDSHTLWKTGLTKDVTWSSVLPLRKPWRLSWSARISNWLLEDSVFVKDHWETWRFLTTFWLTICYSILTVRGYCQNCVEVWLGHDYKLLVRIVFICCSTRLCSLSLAYRLVTCHNSHDSHRLDFEAVWQRGISNWAPAGGSSDSCQVVMMWLCYAIRCSHSIGNVAIGLHLMRLCYLDELAIWCNMLTELSQ